MQVKVLTDRLSAIGVATGSEITVTLVSDVRWLADAGLQVGEAVDVYDQDGNATYETLEKGEFAALLAAPRKAVDRAAIASLSAARWPYLAAIHAGVEHQAAPLFVPFASRLEAELWLAECYWTVFERHAFDSVRVTASYQRQEVVSNNLPI